MSGENFNIILLFFDVRRAPKVETLGVSFTTVSSTAQSSYTTFTRHSIITSTFIDIFRS